MSYSFPSELDFHMLSKMYPSQKTEYRKQPYNQSSFTPSSGAMAQIILQKSERTFANPATMVLNFNVQMTYSVGSTQADGTNSCAVILGNAWSAWSRYATMQSGGQMIDQIDRPAQLVQKILDATLSPDEKRGMINLGFHEVQPYGNLGYVVPLSGAINSTGNVANVSFSIPLLGALSSTSKMIPMFVNDIELQFTVNSLNDFIRFLGSANTVVTGTATAIINNVELVCETLTLEDASFRELITNYPQVLNVKSQSYSYASGQAIATSGPTTLDYNVPFSLNSLKQFIWWTVPSDAPTPFDSVNPNLQNWNLVLGSTSYPQQAVKATSVAEVYYQVMKSFGSVYSGGHSGSARRRDFARASTAGGEYTDYDATLITNVTPATALAGTLASAKWQQVLDLEVLNNLKESLYSGINTRGGSNLLRLNISRATKANTTLSLHMYACFDIILNFDYVNGVITYSS